jgi:Flp pilus assembly protein TadG
VRTFARRLDRYLRPDRARQRGQALPLFALMIFVLTGSVAIVTDVSWFWVNNQRMQRAADAAALAGAVFLPGDVAGAYSAARASAAQNAYANGVGGVLVTPVQDPTNRRRLIVTVSGPVNTYFARVFGLNTIQESATSKAEFTLPVPMGSPQNYYGVGYFVGATTNTSDDPTVNTRKYETSQPAGTWTNPANAASVNGSNTTAAANNAQEQWSGFGFQGSTAVPNNPTLVVEAMQVRVQGTFIQGFGNSTNCKLQAELSWDGGTSWSTSQLTSALTTSANTYTIGSASAMGGWGGHAWTYADFANFRVRVTWMSGALGTSPCASTRTVAVDALDVQVWSHTVTTTTTTAPQSVLSPTGAVLAPQNFWGAMQSQGAPNIQGDAFMTKYETPLSTLNASYDYTNFYNYGVDIPTGASNGEVWVFDPGFCDVSSSLGTGESWTVGGSNGNPTRQPISAFYQLWNTRGTPWDLTDDSRVDLTSDDNDYQDLSLSDQTLGGTNNAAATSCSGMAWHNGWVQIASGLAGGVKYRLHTFSTDTSALTDQDPATGLNSFAIWSTASGGTPRVYGIGAMESYIRLPGGQASEFYLSQIDAIHAGKTMEIDLWDPGDTGALSASLEILAPTPSSYSPATFSWASARGTSNAGASNCNGLSGTNVTSVVTNTGGSSRMNGCWLTISIALPTTYTAPHPSSDTLTTEAGWWKIRYTMGGSTSAFSTDLTGWKVSIRGNPVHLVR